MVVNVLIGSLAFFLALFFKFGFKIFSLAVTLEFGINFAVVSPDFSV